LNLSSTDGFKTWLWSSFWVLNILIMTHNLIILDFNYDLSPHLQKLEMEWWGIQELWMKFKKTLRSIPLRAWMSTCFGSWLLETLEMIQSFIVFARKAGDWERKSWSFESKMKGVGGFYRGETWGPSVSLEFNIFF
jgi:hypothetical protein